MNNLTRKEAERLCDDFIENNYTCKETAEILASLARKGETAEEIAGFSDSLLKRAEPFYLKEEVFDVCGTGGGAADRFNVSTAVAFVLASLEIKTAKHGNRGSRKPNGSFDLLEELGINIYADGRILSDCLEKTKLAFIFAQKFHPAMKAVAEARKIANCRTIFNLAGPFSNPANVKKQIIGTIDKESIGLLAAAGKIIGKECLVVSGFPAIDELSISGPSIIAGLETIKEITPEQIGLARRNFQDTPGGNAKDNAKEFFKLVDGSGDEGLEDMVCLNAGLAYAFSTKGAGANLENIKNGVREARNALRTGLVRKKFIEYKKASNQKSETT